LTALTPLIEQATVVITMRYHGAIFAGLAGKASFGYAQPKIESVYQEMNAPGKYGLDFNRLSERLLVSEPAQSGSSLFGEARAEFRARLESLVPLMLL
jgi:polysaccharide pyruvyl transferase WcaK-like protein